MGIGFLDVFRLHGRLVEAADADNLTGRCWDVWILKRRRRAERAKAARGIQVQGKNHGRIAYE